jgi:predicted RecA/RadA family phage recombinase
MQATFIQTGSTIDYTPDGSDVDAGDVVVQNNSVGVAKHKILDGELGALATEGIFDFAHDAVAKSAGEAVYWDADGNPVGGTAGSGCATKTSTNNTYIGKVVEAATDSDTSVRVRLIDAASVTVNNYGPLSHEIADPGDGEAIPVTASGYVSIAVSDNGEDETNTLAVPTFAGQMLSLSCESNAADDDRVITVTGGKGFNTITLDAAGETVVLVGVPSGASFAWAILADPDSLTSTV